MFVLKLGGQIDSLAFGPDSKALFATSAERGLLWWRDPMDGTEPRSLTVGPLDRTGSVRCLADGRWVEWRDGHTLAVFDATSGERVALVEPFVRTHNVMAALIPDGSAVLTSRMLSGLGAFQSALELLPLSDPRSEAATWSVTVPGVIWDDALFLPDGTAVLLERRHRAGRARGELFLVGRDPASGRERWSSPGGEDSPRSSRASADGRLVAAWHATYLTVWRIGEWDRPPVRIKNDGTKHYTATAFHPSGRFLAATSNDSTVKLYDTRTWEVVQAFAWDIGRLRSVAFAPDGCRAAVGSDKGQILLWDVDV